ncbi:hypothetical protein FCIRC_5953 [Fusarium circinatum]|uniref:Uncharacterized protein n=1 Tax=Fusarium circinatum TaxID=48490 RepID=A0A8H5U2R3_FUSCI|nr:hypothetical protein FCIRC_5953 [Fusarium circinatum]
MSFTQSPFEDPSHGEPLTGIRDIFRALSVRQQEKSQEKKTARQRQQNWTLPDSGDSKNWTLEEIQQEYGILLKNITHREEITNAGNVANQCRKWVHDSCKHPEPENVHLAMKGISDADKRITALQTQIRGYVDALRQWLNKEPGF